MDYQLGCRNRSKEKRCTSWTGLQTPRVASTMV